MTRSVISVDGLGKRYTIRHGRSGSSAAYRRFSEELVSAILAPFQSSTVKRRMSGPFERISQASEEEFWALRNVTFELGEGEVLGIIGRNGAGKSTLLKILSRITEPTEGRAIVRGRIASLLEVGTGFHPELTGRENIFLNGAILGMRRLEVRKRFDEIVEFAGVGKFLDTPVKRYSSGMYVRLAFAVAAHLQTDILLVDEVLAVGDSEFQKKCLGRMQAVSREVGRTVIFVSHNLGAVAALCSAGLVLAGGSVVAHGTASQAISAYLDLTRGRGASVEFPADPSIKNQIRSVRVSQNDDGRVSDFDHAEPIRITIETQITDVAADTEVSIRISNEQAIPLFTLNRSDSVSGPVAGGRTEGAIWLPGGLFPEGTYTLTCAIRQQRRVFDLREDCVTFSVHDSGSSLAGFSASGTGVVLMKGVWTETELSGNRGDAGDP